jgi:hypothetical protein
MDLRLACKCSPRRRRSSQVPNTFRIAVVCDAFERVAPLTGRYEGVLVLIWKELIRSIFADFTNDLPGQGAKAYAERTSPPSPCLEPPPPRPACMSVLTTAPSPHRYAERTPYFLEAKRLRALVEDHERTMRRMRAQRDAELEAINGRNALINKTLGAWNRALGNASAQGDVEGLKVKISELERLLREAAAEVRARARCAERAVPSVLCRARCAERAVPSALCRARP